MRFLPAADAHGDLPPGIDVDALLLGSGEADLEQVAGHVDGGDLASQEELRPGRLGVVAHGLRELAVVDRGVRFRPDRSLASDVRLVTADVGGRQQLELVFAHAVGQAPLPVLFEPPLVLLAEGDLEGGDLEPREAAGGGVGLPHAVGDLGAPREDLAADRIEVEGAMDDARVSPRRMRGDVDLLLEDRDATLILLGEPVGDRGPEDSSADASTPGGSTRSGHRSGVGTARLAGWAR